MELLNNIDKIHTTELGMQRIQRNLRIDFDGVEYCKKIILNPDTKITRKGKNYYCEYNDIIITVNSYSFTIITAKKYSRK